MVSFESALEIVLSQEFTPAAGRVPLTGSPGRILAEDIFSDMDMPPFDKSAVDGFACRWEDVHPGAGVQNSEPLRVVETIPAGKIPAKKIGPGECARIMTGAMVPPGAGCVIMVEDTEPAGTDLVMIRVIPKSKNICPRAEDIRSGSLVLAKGTRIGAAHVAVMAAVGVTSPLVSDLPSVGIISTGDELVEPSVVPGMAKIRNSNGWQLEAQVAGVPAIPRYLGIAPDEGPALKKIITEALEAHDVVLLTGGVSMGDFDHVPAILAECGVGILFKKVAIQPGKPTVFGKKGKKFVFGLPGNPVSSFVLFEMMVRPFLNRMTGSRETIREFILPMGAEFSRRKSDRKTMIPVNIRNGAVFPVEYHGSAHINAYAVADGILVLEAGTTLVTKGEPVHVRPL
jgi:molybdopterin molybdotransferase